MKEWTAHAESLFCCIRGYHDYHTNAWAFSGLIGDGGGEYIAGVCGLGDGSREVDGAEVVSRNEYEGLEFCFQLRQFLEWRREEEGLCETFAWMVWRVVISRWEGVGAVLVVSR